MAREFTKEEGLQIINTIRQQIRDTAPATTLMSWGVSKMIATIHKDMPTLGLRVSGLLHKGWVYICYDYGTDTYIIYLYSVRGKLKKEITDVYCDELAEVIDTNIERGTMTDEQYHKRAFADSARKMKK